MENQSTRSHSLVGYVVTAYRSLRKVNKKAPGCLEGARKFCQQEFTNQN